MAIDQSPETGKATFATFYDSILKHGYSVLIFPRRCDLLVLLSYIALNSCRIASQFSHIAIINVFVPLEPGATSSCTLLNVLHVAHVDNNNQVVI